MVDGTQFIFLFSDSAMCVKSDYNSIYSFPLGS